MYESGEDVIQPLTPPLTHLTPLVVGSSGEHTVRLGAGVGKAGRFRLFQVGSALSWIESSTTSF